MKRLLISILCIIAIFSFAACASAPTADEIIKKSQESMAGAKNMTLAGDMNMDIAGMKLTPKFDAEVFTDPLKVHMKMTGLAMVGDSETYMDTADGKLVSYTHMMDQWVKQEIGTSEEALKQLQIQSPQSIADYMKNLEDVVLDEKTQEINGKEAYKISARVNGDYFKNNNQYETMLASLANGQDIKKLLENIDMNIPFVMYIDKKDMVLLRYEMDMSAMMQSLMKNVENMLKEQNPQATMSPGVDLSGGAFLINMDIKDINSTKDFTIPDDAKNAQPLQPLTKQTAPSEDAGSATDAEESPAQ